MHFGKRLRAACGLTAFLAGLCGSFSGAAAQTLPPRPTLDPGRDTNSAMAYYGYGLHILSHDPVKAQQAFFWATRIDPAVAEAWYARWITAVLSQSSLDLGNYLVGTNSRSRDSTLHTMDWLKIEAEKLDPLIHEGLDYLIIQRWISDQAGDVDLNQYVFGHPDLGGWLAYSHGDFAAAERDYANAVKEYPRAYGLHWDRGRSFLLQLAFDSALVEMRIYRDSLRAGNEKERWWFIQSHEMTDYAIGRVEELRGNVAAARQEYDTALIENLGFAPAHAALARLAVARGDTTDALREYDAATQLADPPTCYTYGVLLWASHHAANAATQFQRAIAADSDYVPPYLPLGILEEGAGNDSVAVRLYRRFIAQAPQNFANLVRVARQHLDGLAAKTPGRP